MIEGHCIALPWLLRLAQDVVMFLPLLQWKYKGKIHKGGERGHFWPFIQCHLQLQQYVPSTIIRMRCLTTNTAENQNNVFTFGGSLISITKLSPVTTTHIHYHPKPNNLFRGKTFPEVSRGEGIFFTAFGVGHQALDQYPDQGYRCTLEHYTRTC